VPARAVTVGDLQPISAQPADLLCSIREERAAQHLACDAYKEYREPVSPITRLGKTRLAIRYTFVPSFSTWSVVRVEFTKSNGMSPVGSLTIKSTVDGKHGEAKKYAQSYRLSSDEASQILQSLDTQTAFASQSVNPRTRGCLDGMSMDVELADAKQYKWFSLTCLDEPDARQNTLYSLASVLISIVKAHADKSLGEFPGP
jgi:hypothetical protein